MFLRLAFWCLVFRLVFDFTLVLALVLLCGVGVWILEFGVRCLVFDV